MEISTVRSPFRYLLPAYNPSLCYPSVATKTSIALEFSAAYEQPERLWGSSTGMNYE